MYYVPEIEDLHHHVLKNSPVLRDIIEAIQKLEKTAEAGYAVTYHKKHGRHVLKSIPGLFEIIDHEHLRNARKKEKPRHSETAKAVSLIENHFNKPAHKAALRKALDKMHKGLHSIKTPTHEKLSHEELKKLMKHFELQP